MPGSRGRDLVGDPYVHNELLVLGPYLSPKNLDGATPQTLLPPVRNHEQLAQVDFLGFVSTPTWR